MPRRFKLLPAVLATLALAVVPVAALAGDDDDAPPAPPTPVTAPVPVPPAPPAPAPAAPAPKRATKGATASSPIKKIAAPVQATVVPSGAVQAGGGGMARR